MPYKDRQDPSNIEKARKSRREYYSRNKDSEKERIQRRAMEIKRWFREYKETLSCPCGENHPACLEFHHRENKDKDLAIAVANGWSKKRILKEIDKCTILCANCHRKLHAGASGRG